ncbi:MAG TPA: Gfo/Idh/MocA family oxidoreductase [Tepidisphaeraceae bacterium]|jgi:predicted dehydrogenase|nr:Gfo/Idh/MocA family oxidoreductase [Tepidisphaeraceae bacterium]
MSEQQNIDRRDFLRVAAIASAAGLAGCAASGGHADSRPMTSGTMAGFAAPTLGTIRVGVVGIGARGPTHVNNLTKMPGVEIKAICDNVQGHAEHGAAIVTNAGKPAPELYTRGDHDYERMNDRDDLDLIVNAAPWGWHVPMSLDAMKKGKHAFTEVPFAGTIDDCWAIVEMSEKTRKHCVMMENCCYGEMELMCLRLAREGMFGELIHGEGAYLHHIADEKLGAGQPKAKWRLEPSIKYDGNTYPTHGLGPVAQYMGVNRGDRFDYMVSLSSPSMGLHLRAVELFGAEDVRSKTKYKQGDVNTSIIKTARGRTIMVQHDTSNPRPYSRINTIQGTKGIFCGYPDRIAFGEEWGDLAAISKKYMHPLWAKHEAKAIGGGHGGMDYVMMARLLDCLHQGLPLDMDVYDAAAVCAVTELSRNSIAKRGGSVDFPDFTRGQWKVTPELGVVS